MNSTELAAKLRDRLGDLVSEPRSFRGETTVEVTDPEKIAVVCAVAKNELACDYLVDISGVDNYGEDPRWLIVYELYGLAHRCHLRLHVRVREEISALPSVAAVWRAADWHEREIFDMLGITFRGHPDLRRILMWDGYPHYPLRKDFPLAGLPTELPGVAFSEAAPMEGGPFVTTPGVKDAAGREPRARPIE